MSYDKKQSVLTEKLTDDIDIEYRILTDVPFFRTREERRERRAPVSGDGDE